MQSLAIRKTLESNSREHRRDGEIAQDLVPELEEIFETVASNEESVSQTEPFKTQI